MFNNFPFLKQNRVTKRLALLASDRIVTVKKELKKETVDDEKLNNNVEPVKEIVLKSELSKKQETKEDPFQLPIPGDYDDYWYFGEDGEWYNEYDDELDEGYYYQKEKKLPAWCTDTSNAIPKPSDYEDYWYEGEDGQWYNEYDDELEEGQYYADKTDDAAEADKKKEQERVEKEKREAEEAKRVEDERRKAEARRKVEEEARKKKEAAEKAAKEAAKAAEEAAKKMKEKMSGFGFGFGSKPQQEKKSSGLGIGGVFGSQTEKKSPQPPQADKPTVKEAPAPAAKTVQEEVKPPAISVPKDEAKVESKVTKLTSHIFHLQMSRGHLHLHISPQICKFYLLFPLIFDPTNSSETVKHSRLNACSKYIFDRRRVKDCLGLLTMTTSGTRRMESGTMNMMTSSGRVNGIKKSQRRTVIPNQISQRSLNLHLNLHQSLYQ